MFRCESLQEYPIWMYGYILCFGVLIQFPEIYNLFRFLDCCGRLHSDHAIKLNTYVYFLANKCPSRIYGKPFFSSCC